MPLQAYFELSHKGCWQADSFLSFLFSPEARDFFFTRVRPLTISPGFFGQILYHLRFIGYLFTFALIALPFFLRLQRESGKRFIGAIARLANFRGGLLVFVIPLALVIYALLSIFPGDGGWAVFTFILLFFVFGYVLIADARFSSAIRQDWALHLE